MTTIYESRERADEATEKLKVYAQPQRLMILSYLLRGEG
ncbi:MAG: transcriptional regulator, partial [Parasphingorhabdus sp.]